MNARDLVGNGKLHLERYRLITRWARRNHFATSRRIRDELHLGGMYLLRMLTGCSMSSACAQGDTYINKSNSGRMAVIPTREVQSTSGMNRRMWMPWCKRGNYTRY